MYRSIEVAIILTSILFLPLSSFAYQVSPSLSSRASRTQSFNSALFYEPQWKKKETLADKSGGISLDKVGIKGTINVVFKQGEETKNTLANVGDPIRDLASQTGQFIKYGCGKGECGSCEALCNGKWIRPCVAKVPADLTPGEDFMIQVKEAKSQTVSSGKFFSIKSFFMGFYNNLLGMIGFVLTRRAAKRNYDERMDYEVLVAEKARQKKLARLAAQKGAAAN